MLEAGAPLDEIAFLNLVPWRTDPEKMNAANWRDAATRGYSVLARQLQVLAPRELIVLGKSTEDLLHGIALPGVPETTIERSNGDRFTKPTAAIALAELKLRMSW
jgi:hypothetical protein